jgi:hypothetical protein
MPKAEAASNNAIVRNCAYASARFFRGPLGHVVLDPPKALRASRIFFRPSVTPAFRANFSASAWVGVAPFASISLCRTVIRSAVPYLAISVRWGAREILEERRVETASQRDRLPPTWRR